MLGLWLWMAAALAATPVVLPASAREIVVEDDVGAAISTAYELLGAHRFDDAARLLVSLADSGGGVDLRYLEALARYEAGDLRRAQRAFEVASAQPGGADHAPLLALGGLILADLGRGAEAIVVLDRAVEAGASAGDRPAEARAWLNRGLVGLDLGDPAAAREPLERARALAAELGDAELGGRAEANLALAGALEGAQIPAQDLVGHVAERLRRGDVEGALHAVPPEPAAADRRAHVRRELALAGIARATGSLDEAAARATSALGAAREGGLVRESALALAELGVVYGLAGRYGLARDRLMEAVGLVAGTSFAVAELQYRVQAGLVSLRAGDAEQAAAQLSAAQGLVGRVTDAIGAARVDELAGAVAASRLRDVEADAAWQRAASALEARGYWADAARVSTAAVQLHAQRNPDAVSAWAERATVAFGRAGDTVGEAHVLIAEGLGRASARDLEGALAAFADAATAAEGTATERGRQVAAIAQENAAQALLALGHSDAALGSGLDDAVARHQLFRSAEAAYERGRDAFAIGSWDAATAAFDEAFRGFSEQQETGYALTSRHARAWSMYNALLDADLATSGGGYASLVEEAQVLGDPELRARAAAGHALSRAALDKADAASLLETAATDVETYGLPLVAGRLWAELAERAADLDSRAAAARRASALTEGDPTGAYALYSVAVDAYNVGRYQLALDLVGAISSPGQLADAVHAVRQASEDELASAP